MNEIQSFIDRVSKGLVIEQSNINLGLVISFLEMSDIDVSGLEFIGNPNPVVFSNKFGLSLVLINLIRNAQEVANDKVKLIFEEIDNSIRIDVVDDGPGLSEDQIANIWSDVSTNSDPNRVRGLGTQIVSYLCEKLSIRIEVESSLGNGARFSLYVPR